jgi:hypothetical protein
MVQLDPLGLEDLLDPLGLLVQSDHELYQLDPLDPLDLLVQSDLLDR